MVGCLADGMVLGIIAISNKRLALRTTNGVVVVYTDTACNAKGSRYGKLNGMEWSLKESDWKLLSWK